MNKTATEQQLNSGGIWDLFEWLAKSRGLSVSQRRLTAKNLDILGRLLSRLLLWMKSSVTDTNQKVFVEGLRELVYKLETDVLTVGFVQDPTRKSLKWFLFNLERLDAIFAPEKISDSFAKLASAAAPTRKASMQDPEVLRRVTHALMAKVDYAGLMGHIAGQLIDTAKGAKNPRDAKRYMSTLAGRLGLDEDAVEEAHLALFPPKHGY